MTVLTMETNTTASENHIGGKVDNLLLQSAQCNDTMTLINNNLSQIGVTFDSFKAQAQKHMEVSTVGMSSMQSQLAEIMQALDSTESEMVFKRVVSKPDALRIVCDDVCLGQKVPGTMTSNGNQERISYPELQYMGCQCKGRRTRKQMRRGLGPGFFVKESYQEKAHALGCQFSEIGSSETRWSLGVSATVFRNILSTAITVSMSLSHGAGGFSLSPTFRVYHVNHWSPVLKVFDKLWRSASMDPETFPAVLNKGIKALQWMFKTGNASPFDVDSDGENLLHYASSGLRFGFHPRSDMGLISPLLKFLVDIGVPRDRPCSRGRLPSHQLFSWMAYFSAYDLEHHTNVSDDYSRRSRTRNFDILWPDDLSLISVSWGKRYGAAIDVGFLPQLVSTYPTMSEWYGDDFHTMILRQDEISLIEFLQTHALGTELSETGAFDLTPLELLALWPLGLKLVLQKLGNSAVSSNDSGSAKALNCAMLWSGRSCSGSRETRCSVSCHCAESVRLLLEADCRMSIDYIWASMLSKASLRCQELVIQALTSRRNKLTELALAELSPKEIEKFGLSKGVLLDIQTNDVLHALNQHGISIHQRLHTGISQRQQDRQKSASIYHVLLQTGTEVGRLVDIAYSKGFHEVDVPDADGNTPSMFRSPSCHLTNLLAMNNHGENQDIEIPESAAGYTAKHRIMDSVDWADKEVHGRNFEIVAQNQYELFRNSSLTDMCRCHCSVDGCHPYTIMWKSYRSNWRVRRRSNLLKWILSLLCRFESHGDPDWHFKSVTIRVATFEALKIRHTCCSPWGTKGLLQRTRTSKSSGSKTRP